MSCQNWKLSSVWGANLFIRVYGPYVLLVSGYRQYPGMPGYSGVPGTSGSLAYSYPSVSWPTEVPSYTKCSTRHARVQYPSLQYHASACLPNPTSYSILAASKTYLVNQIPW